MSPSETPEEKREKHIAMYRHLGKIMAWSGWGVALLSMILGGYLTDHLKAHLRELEAGNREYTENLPRQKEALDALSEAGAIIFLRGANARALGKLFVNRDDRRAVLVAKGLPIPPADQSYFVWLIKTGNPLPAGSFVVDSLGTGFLNVTASSPLRDFQAVAVTCQPAGTKTQTGSIILAGQF